MSDGVRHDTVGRISEMYREGKTLAEIEQETGVSRPTIYNRLRKAGIRPNRTKAGRTDDELKEWALGRVSELEREVGALMERLRFYEPDAR